MAHCHTGYVQLRCAVHPSPPRAPLGSAAHRHPAAPKLRASQTSAQATAPVSSSSSSSSSSDFFKPGQEAESRQKLFDNIAPVYDQLNDRLSLGLHRVWKRMTVKWSRAALGDAALDVCCGSGDLSFLLAEAVGPAGQVVGLDFSGNMLQDAAARQQLRQQEGGPAYSMRWVQGDALQLPFEAASFDAATMGYGLRNVASIPTALQELHRVLRPGGTVAILDFNNIENNPLVDTFQALMLEQVVVPTARQLGVAEEYEYLRPSIKRFPTGRELVALAKEAGFSRATHYEIAFGLMGVLVATKAG